MHMYVHVYNMYYVSISLNGFRKVQVPDMFAPMKL